MTGPVTDEQLAEWEKLAEVATPGPWHVEESRWDIPGCTEVDQIVCAPTPSAGAPRDGIADVFDGHYVIGEEERPVAPNLNFIAAVRSAFPLVLRELRAARTRQAAVEALLDCGEVSPESGCCSACDGTGFTNDPSTGGGCWDCRGSGHSHAPAECEPDFIAALRRALAAAVPTEGNPE